MANALQLGTKLIPIIQHFDLTGTTPTATPTLPITETTADRFGLGTSVAFAHYPLSTSSESPTQEVYISDTELVLHDNTFIQFDLQEDSMVYPTATLILSASHNGSPVSLIPGLVNMLLYPGRNSMSSSVAETFETNFVAYSFAWPDATDPAYQRKGYLIYKTRRITNTYPAGNFNVQFDEQSLWVNCPYYNKNNNWDTYIEETPVPDPDDPPFDPTIPDDYNPHIDDTSDLISIPSSPTIGVSNAGWVHVYSPSTGALVNFGEWLFPNPELPSSADPTEIVNYLLLLCQTISNSRLIDYILDCHIIPVTPSVSTSQDIQVGGRTATGITAPIVSSDYIDVSCGSLNIQEYFAGFQDYLYTKSKLYLPFVGFVDMIPEYWQSGTIAVDYKFNVIDGSFMCYVRSASSKSQLAGSVIAQYSGNCCVHIPITGVNYANMVSGLVGAASSAEGAKSASSVLGAAYSAANTISQGGGMLQSNAYNSTAAFLGVRYPYLVIERPRPANPSKYAHDKGYPSNLTVSLSSISGFTTLEDIDLSGIPLTQGELEELRGLLKEGVYF